MKVLVDTNIWSLALRRRNTPENDVVAELRRLIGAEQPLLPPDIIRLEIPAGITPLERQRSVRRDLDAFPALKLSTTDYDLAAEYFSVCASKGVLGGLAVVCGLHSPQNARLHPRPRFPAIHQTLTGETAPH